MPLDLSRSRSIYDFRVGDVIHVHDTMQRGYRYTLVMPIGQQFDDGFTPEVAPAEMLRLGVFEGKYVNDCAAEFPREWYETAMNNLSPDVPDITKNCFNVKSRLSLTEWRRREWITPGDPDPRGWFQWYCRYYLGRRIPDVDTRQIRRWRAFRRHAAQVRKNCHPGDLACRPRQRQALLQWAYDPFI